MPHAMNRQSELDYLRQKFAGKQTCCTRGCLEKLYEDRERLFRRLDIMDTWSTAEMYQEAKQLLSGSKRLTPKGRIRVEFQLPEYGRVCQRVFLWYYSLTNFRLRTIKKDFGNPEAFSFKNKAGNKKQYFRDIVQPLVVKFMLDLSAQCAESDPRRPFRQTLGRNGKVREYLPLQFGPTKLHEGFLDWFEREHPHEHTYCSNYFTQQHEDGEVSKRHALSERSFRRYCEKADEINHIRVRAPRDNVCDRCCSLGQPKAKGESRAHPEWVRFLIPGHTHFTPDRGFSLVKTYLRQTDRFDLDDFDAAVKQSPFSEGVRMRREDWRDFRQSFKIHFREFSGIQKYRHFVFRNDEPNDIGYCLAIADPTDSKVDRVRVLKKDVMDNWLSDKKFPENFLLRKPAKLPTMAHLFPPLECKKRLQLWSTYKHLIPENKRKWLAPTPAQNIREMTEKEIRGLKEDEWEEEKYCTTFEAGGGTHTMIDQGDHDSEANETVVTCVNCNEDGHPESVCTRRERKGTVVVPKHRNM